MAVWRTFGCLAAVVALSCKGDDKPDDPKPQPPAAVDPDKRCLQLGKLCGDTNKHVDKIVEECKKALKQQASCTVKLIAAYDCFERELCSKADKVWTIGDLGVLAERHGKCAAERKAANDCAPK